VVGVASVNEVRQMQPPHSTDSALIALGFTRTDDGTLTAPVDSVVTLTPTGAFFELRISLNGNAVVAVLSKSAIKVSREGKS
jgi:hypothetical protein